MSLALRIAEAPIAGAIRPGLAAPGPVAYGAGVLSGDFPPFAWVGSGCVHAAPPRPPRVTNELLAYILSLEAEPVERAAWSPAPAGFPFAMRKPLSNTLSERGVGQTIYIVTLAVTPYLVDRLG